MKTTTTPRHYTSVDSYHELPEMTVTQEMVDKARRKLGNTFSVGDLLDSEWSELSDQFYQERIVFVQSNNVLFLRFSYDYEIDLDRIPNEAALLRWALHFCEKTWMNTERLHCFIEATADILKLRIHGLGNKPNDNT